ncbi:MAG: NAD(P)H-dependent oxidoreductase [Pseudomonadota bacterium]
MTNSLKILQVHSSGRREGSTSRRLSDAFVDGLTASGRAIDRTVRDLADGVPFVDDAWIGANFTPQEERSAEQSAVLATSDMFVREVQDADVIVIGAPVYNFSVPALLKAWIDQIARARVTFKYTENGPVGLLEGKKAVIVMASGGTAIGAPNDFSTDYLKYVLGFMGITDVSVIAASQQMLDAEKAESEAAAQTDAAIHHVLEDSNARAA